MHAKYDLVSLSDSLVISTALSLLSPGLSGVDHLAELSIVKPAVQYSIILYLDLDLLY